MSNWVQQTLPWRLQRQAVALAALGLFIAVIIGALYLAQSTSVATLGRQLETLLARRNQLEQTNEQLRTEIAELRSVPRLLARAQELGFVAADEANIEYLYVNGYNPNRDQIITVAQPPSDPLPTYDESFVGWLQQVWDSFSKQFQGYSSQGQ